MSERERCSKSRTKTRYEKEKIIDGGRPEKEARVELGEGVRVGIGVRARLK